MLHARMAESKTEGDEVAEQKEGAIKADESTTAMSGLATFQKYVPSFVLGFVGMSVMRSIGDYTLLQSSGEAAMAYGLVEEEQYKAGVKFIGSTASKYLLGTAMAGVGLSTSMAVLRGVGWRFVGLPSIFSL